VYAHDLADFERQKANLIASGRAKSTDLIFDADWQSLQQRGWDAGLPEYVGEVREPETFPWTMTWEEFLDREAEEGRRRGRGHHHVLGRAIHGDLIVCGEDGTWQNVTVDRGTVTAVNESSVEIERPDGQKVTAALDENTRYGPDRDRTDIQTGQPAMVVQKDGKALAVMQKDPNRRGGPRGEGRPPREPAPDA
jgi:hypothetical protein